MFKRKKEREWIIEDSRSKKFGKREIVLKIIYWFVIIGVLLYIFWDRQINNFDWIVLVLLLINTSADITVKFHRELKEYWPILVVPTIALVVIGVIIHCYPDDNVLTRADILGFSGSYLSAVGAFSLGYFIFRYGVKQEKNEKIGHVRQLLALIQRIDIDLIAAKSSLDCITKNSNRKYLINTISTEGWNDLFIAYEELSGENTELRRTFESFFRFVEKLNSLIEQKEYVAAKEYYEKFYEAERYDWRKYNLSEAKMCLFDAVYDNKNKSNSWLERKDNIDLIERLCTDYYYIIENQIYILLLRNNVDTTKDGKIDGMDVQKAIVDWLLQSSPELKSMSHNPNLCRITSYVVFLCSIRFREKSNRINFVWGEYSLKSEKS